MDITAASTFEGKAEGQGANPVFMLKGLFDANAGKSGGLFAEGGLLCAEGLCFSAVLSQQVSHLFGAIDQKGEGAQAKSMPEWMSHLLPQEQAFLGSLPVNMLDAISTKLKDLKDDSPVAITQAIVDVLKEIHLSNPHGNQGEPHLKTGGHFLAHHFPNQADSVKSDPLRSNVSSSHIVEGRTEGHRQSVVAQATIGQLKTVGTAESGVDKNIRDHQHMVSDRSLQAPDGSKTDTRHQPVIGLKTDATVSQAAEFRAQIQEMTKEANVRTPVTQTGTPVQSEAERAGQVAKTATEATMLRQDAGVSADAQRQMLQAAKKDNNQKHSLETEGKGEHKAGHDMRAQDVRPMSTAESNERFKAELRGAPSATDKVRTHQAGTHQAGAIAEAGTQTRPTAQVSPQAIVDRVTAEFRETLGQESGRVRMTLTPPSLGTLEMEVLVRNGKVKVFLSAESRDVQRILSANIDGLKSSLSGQGMTIERCEVMLQDRRDAYAQQDQGQGQMERQSRDSREGHHKNESGDDPTRPGTHPNSVRTTEGDADSISLFA